MNTMVTRQTARQAGWKPEDLRQNFAQHLASVLVQDVSTHLVKVSFLLITKKRTAIHAQNIRKLPWSLLSSIVVTHLIRKLP
jgi:hypothetical protein